MITKEFSDFLEVLDTWEYDNSAKRKPEEDFADLQDLIGKSIKSVLVEAQGQESIIFVCEGDQLVAAETGGDCCSESWISDAIGVPKILESEVLSVTKVPLEEMEYPVNDGRTRQDIDVVYGFRIRTNSGSAVFAFRNSSNGYYGGSLDKHGRPAELLLKNKFVEIKTDLWMAD